jgi:hypothetical protein
MNSLIHHFGFLCCFFVCSVFAAVHPLLNGLGGYYLDNNTIPTEATTENTFHGFASFIYDENSAKRLWEESLKWTKLA